MKLVLPRTFQEPKLLWQAAVKIGITSALFPVPNGGEARTSFGCHTYTYENINTNF